MAKPVEGHHFQGYKHITRLFPYYFPIISLAVPYYIGETWRNHILSVENLVNISKFKKIARGTFFWWCFCIILSVKPFAHSVVGRLFQKWKVPKTWVLACPVGRRFPKPHSKLHLLHIYIYIPYSSKLAWIKHITVDHHHHHHFYVCWRVRTIAHSYLSICKFQSHWIGLRERLQDTMVFRKHVLFFPSPSIIFPFIQFRQSPSCLLQIPTKPYRSPYVGWLNLIGAPI